MVRYVSRKATDTPGKLALSLGGTSLIPSYSNHEEQPAECVARVDDLDKARYERGQSLFRPGPDQFVEYAALAE
jgi:hypothetical protein